VRLLIYVALFSDTYDIEPEPGLPDFSGHKVPKYTRMAIKVPKGNNICIPGLPDFSGHKVPKYTRMAGKVPNGNNICMPGLPDFSGHNLPKYTRIAIKVPKGHNICMYTRVARFFLTQHTKIYTNGYKSTKGHNICIPGLPDFLDTTNLNRKKYTRMATRIPNGHNKCIPKW
jgi:hypothetical protein